MNDETLPRILVVDDDRALVEGLRRQLRAEFSVETAVGGPEGLIRLRDAGPFSVVLSDYRMPQMNGAAFLAEVRQVCPDTTRMLLTGHADLGGAAEVVNQGGVSRFLIKPVSREILVEALHSGVEQYRLATAERELAERTLDGSVKALTELLSLASPLAFARATRLRRLAGELLAVAGETLPWHVDLAVMLSQIGAITLPPDVLERMEANAELAPEEEAMVSRLPALAEQVLAGVPRLEEVRAAIRWQGAPYAGGPGTPAGQEIPLGSRVLRVVSDYDALVAAGQGVAKALQVMSARPGAYEPRLLDALATVVGGFDNHPRPSAPRRAHAVPAGDAGPGPMTRNLETMAGPGCPARERLLAEASARLVAAGDRQTVLAVATETAAAMMGRGPGWGSALLVGAGSHMTVTRATGALEVHEGHNVSTENLPAGVRASLGLGHAAQWPADLLSLGFPATGGHVPPGAVLVPLGVRDASHGLLVVTGPGEARAAAEAALSVLAGQVAMTLEGLGSARWVETVIEQASELILVLEPDATIRFANGAVRRRLGWDPAALVQTPFLDLLDGDGTETVLSRLEDLVAARSERCAADFRLRHAGGGGVDVEGTMTSLLAAPDVRGIVLTLRDVRERKSLEAQLAHWVRHDPLTNLANRALLEDHLDTLAAAGEPLAVLLLDIDDFKAVNDRLGPHEGDRLLVMAADRLRRRARTGDLVARSGGDEFVLVARGVKAAGEAQAVAARLLAMFEEPFLAGSLDARLRASVGIRLSQGQCSDAAQLLRDADLAMCAAKAAGKARWAMFEPAMHTQAEEALAIRAALRQAIPNSELVLHYQPIVAAHTGDLAGFEALVRWRHPLRGLLGPLEFIGHAEETGLIVPMGAWILEESCRKLAQLHTINPALRMSVNLSVRQLECDDIVDQVHRALDGAGIAPAALTLEVTESLLLSETAPVVQRIHELHALGVKLAIDDFGTGFSSLAYLQRLPVDTLKIDRSFVMGLDQAGSSNAVVDGIVRLSEALQLDTVAEGVETAEQLEALKEMGTVFVQGFLFSRPLDDDAATAYAQTSVSLV